MVDALGELRVRECICICCDCVMKEKDSLDCDLREVFMRLRGAVSGGFWEINFASARIPCSFCASWFFERRVFR